MVHDRNRPFPPLLATVARRPSTSLSSHPDPSTYIARISQWTLCSMHSVIRSAPSRRPRPRTCRPQQQEPHPQLERVRPSRPPHGVWSRTHDRISIRPVLASGCSAAPGARVSLASPLTGRPPRDGTTTIITNRAHPASATPKSHRRDELCPARAVLPLARPSLLAPRLLHPSTRIREFRINSFRLPAPLRGEGEARTTCQACAWAGQPKSHALPDLLGKALGPCTGRLTGLYQSRLYVR